VLSSKEYEGIIQMLGGAALIISNPKDMEDLRLKLQLENLQEYVSTLKKKVSTVESSAG
jgi:hypothetical protein